MKANAISRSCLSLLAVLATQVGSLNAQEPENKLSAAVTATFRIDDALPMELVLSPDGHLLFCGGYLGSFNPQTGRVQVAMESRNVMLDTRRGRAVGRLGGTKIIGFSAAGEALVEDEGIRVWDYERNRGRDRLSNVVGSVHISPGGRYGATVVDGARVVLTDLTSRQVVGEYPIPGGGEDERAFLMDEAGTFYVLAIQDGNLSVTDVAAGREVASLPWAGTGLGDVAISRDGKHVAAALGSTLYAWNVQDGTAIEGNPPFMGRLNSLQFSRDGNILGAVTHANQVLLWDLSARETFTNLGGHRGPVTDVRFSLVEDLFYTSSTDGTVKVWRIGAAPPVAAPATRPTPPTPTQPAPRTQPSFAGGGPLFGVAFAVGYNAFGGDDYEGASGGLQFEGLARVSFTSGFEFGAGVMQGTYGVDDLDETITHLEVFAEPRYVHSVASNVAPFVGGRVAWTKESGEFMDYELSATGFTVSGVAGLAVTLSESVMLELSALIGMIDLRDAEIDGEAVSDTESSGRIMGMRGGLSLTIPR